MIERAPAINVPVVVDAIKTLAEFPMVRCNYLSVECDSPKPGWALRIESEELPFLMLGLVGIVTKPFGAEFFDRVELIEDLYERIEDKADLLIDIDDIWLPISLFNRIRVTPQVGYVYRITSDMFTLALSFREGRLGSDAFINQCHQMERPIVFSETEMSSFSQWREMQIRSALEQYPKNKRLELKWHEEGHGDMQSREVSA